jgi:DHA2 family methylenomycin A resistance protein-like MFS transporter
VLSLYFQQLNGLSAFETGLAFVPMMAAVLPVNLIAPRLAERIGAPATIALGSAVSRSDVLQPSALSRTPATGRSVCN